MFKKLFSAGLLLAVSTSALATAQSPVTFDWAVVGNAGNAADWTGYGAVAYDYRIAKTEVTNAQYAAFLNEKAKTDPLGLYNTNMDLPNYWYGGISRSGTDGNYSYAAQPGREDLPVTLVSWFDSLRFINWLHNGQGSGDTETGAYTLLGGTETPSNAGSITRNPGALVYMPDEDEWYKAAFHDKTAGTAGTYFDYAAGSDLPPPSTNPSNDPSGANYYDGGYAISGTTSLTPNLLSGVGAYFDAPSTYGTFDQNGNVIEWTETYAGNNRVLRGGEASATSFYMRSEFRNTFNGPTLQSSAGIRVAAVIPEPGSLALLGFALPLLARRRLV